MTKKTGRPTIYNDEIATKIFVWIAEGQSLNRFCEKEGNPSKSTVLKWAAENKEFSHQYAKARDFQAESHVDEMMDIVDNECQTPVMIDGEPLVIGGKPVMTVTPAGVSHAKLRVDTRRWIAERMKPKKYGNRQEISHKLPEGSGVLQVPSVLTSEQWLALSQQANKELSDKESSFANDADKSTK